VRVLFSIFPFITLCRRAVTFAALALCLLATTGCPTVHRTIEAKYQPSVAPDLAQLNPVTFRLQVIDQRPSDERDNIGKGGKVIYVLDQDPPKALFAAIKAGLEKNGHRVEVNPNLPADVLLNVEMTRFYYALKSGAVTIQKICTVQANVTAKRIKSDPHERRFPINGTNQTEYVLVGSGAATETVESALAEAVDQLLNDQRLLEVLRSP
jgi:uncharacterized lipoprotein YajG